MYAYLIGIKLITTYIIGISLVGAHLSVQEDVERCERVQKDAGCYKSMQDTCRKMQTAAGMCRG